MTVEFTVKKVVIRPGGHEEVHLSIEDDLNKLIAQLCEDGFATEVLNAVSDYRTKNQEPCTDDMNEFTGYAV